MLHNESLTWNDTNGQLWWEGVRGTETFYILVGVWNQNWNTQTPIIYWVFSFHRDWKQLGLYFVNWVITKINSQLSVESPTSLFLKPYPLFKFTFLTSNHHYHETSLLTILKTSVLNNFGWLLTIQQYFLGVFIENFWGLWADHKGAWKSIRLAELVLAR